MIKGSVLGLMALRAQSGNLGKNGNFLATYLIRRNSSVNPDIPTDKKKELQDIQKNTQYWHGTGRYQYRDGKKVDILKSIVNSGGLMPHVDDIDLVGKMNSISMAKSRIYARAYADMHST